MDHGPLRLEIRIAARSALKVIKQARPAQIPRSPIRGVRAQIMNAAGAEDITYNEQEKIQHTQKD